MTDSEDPSLPTFTAVEARVLACLMEKELATPDNYPLTLNSLTLACNQKSNRDPAMNLTQGEVGHTVNQLADRELIHIEYGERAQRIAHRMRGSLGIDRKQQAVLAVLMLRRPQTLNDLKVRTVRMTEFSDIEELQQTLAQLLDRAPPLAVCLPKGGGRREDRFAHTLGGEVDLSEDRRPVAPADEEVSGGAVRNSSDSSSQGRLDELEQRVTRLEEQLRRLLSENEPES